MKTNPRITAIVAKLRASPELLNRVERIINDLDMPLPVAIQGTEDASTFFACKMAGLASEELHAVYMNRRNAPIGHFMLTRGNDAHTIVDPRQIYREAIRLGASGIILAHNHPSGDPTPSMADVEVTQRCMDAGRVLGIEVLDHLVIGINGSYRSLREEGLIAPSAMPRTGIAASRY